MRFALRTGISGLALASLAAPAYADKMPQFDFGNPLLVAHVVWGAVVFAVLYVLFGHVALPQVASVLEARAQAIGTDLEEARLAKEKADRAVAELTEARRLAYAESQASLAAATQKAKAEAAEQAVEVNARLDRQLADSERQIDGARRAARAALGDVAADTANSVISRLTGRAADPSKVRAAVAASLAARGLAGAG